ncbi:FGGY-family carbohydrate kinase [Streptomyces halobius]|uniref:Carbohydrate kinase n=1 Tax=Streptomyces halobius TaxID=2879846 RepID=A0ABY4M1U8_9ACTN|nr:FGGY-family carbohydrate kinase [Streptomyces halobius]UQA91695.1 carbohydrate kinase [Streptomyces halobius]
MSVLTVDVGTTMIKSVVFDDQGTEIAVSRQATEVLRPHPGWAEQDMDAVWHAVVRTVRAVLADMAGRADPVWLVSFTAQGDGAWLVDDRGRPTGPAILWSDGRAGDQVTAWQHDGVLAAAFRRNGSLTCTGMPNALWSWLAVHDPDRLARSSTSLTAAGWLFLRLTGVRATDESDASAPFLDHATGDYDPHLLDLFGLRGYARLLPTVLGESERIAELTADASAQLGLPAGLPVVMAPYDIAATARGVGVVNPGQACGILGTTLCTEIVRTEIDTSGEPSGVNIAYRGRERVLRAFPTLNGAEVLGWAADMLGLVGPPELAHLAFRSEPGAHGLLFLPYLSPAGERAPFLDPRARGSFWGLSLEHSRADMARAVFDGLSLVLRDSLAAARTDITELRLCGGGANSDAWCALIADATGVPTARAGDTELGAKGAFLTGLVRTGAESSMHSAAAKYVRMRSSWEPDPERAEFYAALYEDFLGRRALAREAGRRGGAVWRGSSTTPPAARAGTASGPPSGTDDGIPRQPAGTALPATGPVRPTDGTAVTTGPSAPTTTAPGGTRV